MKLELQTGGIDIPCEGGVSSVGYLGWPPREAGEQKRKGFFSQVLTTGASFAQAAAELNGFPFSPEVTRYSARALVTEDALSGLSPAQRSMLTPLVEAVVPLAGTGVAALEDTALVYLGRNEPSREADSTALSSELARAQDIFTQPGTSHPRSYDGFAFSVLTEEDRQNAALQAQYAELYRAFGWNEQEVVRLLTSPQNVLVAAFFGDELVSAGMAERAVINPVRDGVPHRLTLYEITEAATKLEYRGNGLYTQVAFALMRELVRRGDGNLMYAESNLAAEGVLRSAARQGRTSALDGLARYGFPPNALRQHVTISQGAGDCRPEGPKNNLLVTSISRREAAQRYG